METSSFIIAQKLIVQFYQGWVKLYTFAGSYSIHF